MSIPIPYAMDYTSTVSGGVLKLVRCEGCGAEYVYRLEREATGGGTSVLFLDNEGAAARATSRDAEALHRKLDRGLDVVPCPGCGWYQAAMIPKARREHRRWMLTAGAGLTLGLLPVLFVGGVINSARRGDPLVPWPLFVGGMATLAALGVGLMLAKVYLSRRYDPNAQDAEARKRQGQQRAVLRADFERMVTQAGAPPSSAQSGNA